VAAALRDLDHAPSQEEIAAGRDLKLYDDGGTFSSKISDHGAIPRISELRDFLWSHWSRKRRGYVRLEFSDVDGTVRRYLTFSWSPLTAASGTLRSFSSFTGMEQVCFQLVSFGASEVASLSREIGIASRRPTSWCFLARW
jgi:hypothetical protein